MFLTYSKHLHIVLAPVNVLSSRAARTGWAPLQPMRSGGKVLDFEEADPDTDIFGRGKIEDFTWKGLLDFTSCTECGRCQSQCPAWNTEKPLSPKLLVMGLREHAFAKAPYLQAAKAARETLPQSAPATRRRGRWSGRSRSRTGWPGVVDPDVLWSCTTCGACVQQCPVDIEHVDHILDMRRFQVLMESEFPSELFKGLEKQGQSVELPPNPGQRLDWAKSLSFDVPVVGEDARGSELGRVLVLGRLRGGPEARTAKEDHPGGRGAAAHRGREFRGAGQG